MSKLITSIWLLLCSLFACYPSNDASAAFATPCLRMASTVTCDGQIQITIAYDSSDESSIRYDAVPTLTNREKEIGTAKYSVPFAKFAEFLAAEGGVAEQGGLNLYRYANDDPISNVDPDGFCEQRGFLGGPGQFRDPNTGELP